MRKALTPREASVLWMFSQGFNKKEIAATLHITPNTVKTYAQKILYKTGAHSQAEAVRIMMERGLMMEGVKVAEETDSANAVQIQKVEQRRVHVIRVIEMIGTAEWMEATLSSSLVSKGHDFRAFNGTIRELAREEIVE